MEPVGDLSIAQQALNCLTLLERLLKLQNDQEPPKNDSFKDALINKQTGLRMWIENNGVLQYGEASLDHRLRHADGRLTVLKMLNQFFIGLNEMWQIFLSVRALRTRISLDDVASQDLSDTESSNDEHEETYHQMQVRNIQRTQARATSPEDTVNFQSKKKDCIEVKDLPPLHRAALQNDVESNKAALKEDGADIEEYSQDGATPLMFAASKGHFYAIRNLLASGANVNAVSSEGWTALMFAVRGQHARVVKQLVFHGADVDHLSPDGWTALTEASFQGQTDIMKILLLSGADTELISAHDWTLLMRICYKGDEAAVKLLLNARANMEATSANGENAMLLAAAGGHTDVVRTLLEYGCEPEPPWAKTQHNGAMVVYQRAEAERIREPNDKVHARGVTPLMFASKGGHVDMALLLLERNVNIEARSPRDKTALEIARENERMDMVLMLENARDTRS